MTQEELNRIIDSDSYFAARKDPSEAEIRLFLREVDFHCPLCGVELQSRQQKKPRHKRFQIAHIYPNRPTIEQYLALDGVERLGNNSESFENKIALCMTCHSTQDFHTTAEDYNRLLNIKKQCLLSSAMNDLSKSLDLEEKISDILLKLTSLSENDIAALNYTPIPVANKFSNSEFLLKSKISGYINSYYPIIREELRQLDGKSGFLFEVLSGQIKNCFLKVNMATNDKSLIFDHMVQWIKNKTLSSSTEACEAVVAYFVQNCEVFYAITE